MSQVIVVCPRCHYGFEEPGVSSLHDQLEASAALEVLRKLSAEIASDPAACVLQNSLDGIRHMGPVGEALAMVIEHAARMRT